MTLVALTRAIGKQRETIALVMLGATIVLAPQLIGGAIAPMKLIVSIAGVVSLLLALWSTDSRAHRATREPAFLVLVGAVAFTALQVVPLPIEIVDYVTESAGDPVRRTHEALGLAEPSWATLSVDPGGTLGAVMIGLGVVSASGAAMILTASGHRRVILWMVAGAAALMAVVALGHAAVGASQVFGLYPPRYARPSLLAPLLNENHLAALLSMGSILTLGLGLSLRGGRRVAVLVAAAVLAATTFLTLSRGGVAALLGGVVLLAFLAGGRRRGRKQHVRLAAGVTLAVGIALAAYVGLDAMLAEFTNSSPGSKLEVAAEALGLAVESPWTGVGRGAFAAAGTQAWGTLTRADHVEVLPVQWAVEWGIPLSLAVLGVLGARWLSVVRRRPPLPRLAAAVALATVFLHDLVDFSLELPGVATVAGALLGATLVERPRSNGDRPVFSGLAWAVAILGVVALIFLGPRTLRHDLLTQQDALQAAATSTPYDQFNRELVDAMLAHPAEPSFPLIGGAAAARRDDPRAVVLLNRAMQLAPGWSSPHEVTAAWLYRRGHTDQALVEIREAAARDPRAGHRLLCQILTHEPRGSTAIRAAPAGTQGVELLNRAAKCLRDHPAEAELVDAELLRRDESALAPRLRRVQRAIGAGDLDGAIAMASAAVESHPQDADALAALAEALLAADRPEQALQRIREGEQHTDDRDTLFRMEARAHAALGDGYAMRDTIDRLRLIAAGRPKPLASALRLRAELELELGNRAQALDALEDAYRLEPRHGTLAQIARLSEALGDRARARRAYLQLSDDFPDNEAYEAGLRRTARETSGAVLGGP